ncbi:putative cytochrome P450 6a13 [Arctopsyche grandis]|uniref:putative cytochrome P450 6a13 n=1 Tax=Arctopsyche grandis TaxID=121162 RepID=UPI00406D82CF
MIYVVQILKKLRDENVDDEGKLKFQGDTLLAQAAIFFSAGFQTISSTISFSLYELAMSPDVQEKVLIEIEEVLNSHNGMVTNEAIQNMKYLGMCIKETLRKYPILPFLDRVCQNRYKIPNTNVILEPQTTVYIPMIGIHMDPQYHPEPEVYRPERFSPENFKHMDPSTYMPFGHGPRNCIGERLGVVETKLGLVHILKDFKVKTCPKTVPKIKFNPKSINILRLDTIYLRFEPKLKSS